VTYADAYFGLEDRLEFVDATAYFALEILDSLVNHWMKAKKHQYH